VRRLRSVLTTEERVDGRVGQRVASVRRVGVHGGVSGGIGVDDLGGGGGDPSHGGDDQQL